jgi:hypothetical protein
VSKTGTLCHLLQLRAGIGDGEKATAGFLRANDLLDAVEEILLENVGLERRSRFARDDEERVLQIDLVLERLHLGRVGRIEYVKLRIAADLSEGLFQHFGTQTRSPHAQQQDIGEARVPGHFGNAGHALDMTQLIIGNPKPAEPLPLVPAGPQRRIPTPELPHFPMDTPFGQ